jgi:lipoxygenase/linoleate 9S-lipoxygenase
MEANSRFMERMQALEARIASRNADPASWARYGGSTRSLAYTLLVPPSPPGLTFKGVPYSVSI